MVLSVSEGGDEGSTSSFPLLLQAVLLLLLSLHALAVGVWGFAFLRDLARGNQRNGPLTSAELNRQERERQRIEKERLGSAAKIE